MIAKTIVVTIIPSHQSCRTKVGSCGPGIADQPVHGRGAEKAEVRFYSPKSPPEPD